MGKTLVDSPRSEWLIIVMLCLIVLGVSIQPGAFNHGNIPQSDQAFSIYRILSFGISYLLALIYLLANIKFIRDALVESAIAALLLSYILLSMMWSYYPQKVLVNFIHYSGVFLVAISFGLSSCGNFKKFLSNFNNVLIITVIASIVTSLIYPSIGRDVDGRWVGLAGHANTLGLVSVLAVWTSLSSVFMSRGRGKLFYIGCFIVALVGVIGSRSVSSWVVCIVVVMGLIVLMTARDKSGVRSVLHYVVVMFSAIVTVLLLYVLFEDYMSIDKVLSLVGKNRTLTGRSALWDMAREAISIKPFFGWSFDSLASVLSNEIKMKYGQFHNGYLNLMVEGGVVGVILFVFLVIHFLLRLVAINRSDRNVFSIWLVILLSILIHNISESSIVRATHIYWIVMLTGYYSVLITSRRVTFNGRNKVNHYGMNMKTPQLS